MKFKGLENNSMIREIGALFRRNESSNWQINVKLDPGQQKQHFNVSQIPILARRRILNATHTPQPAGFQSSVVIESAREWRAELIEACPIPSVSRQEDAQQWCFVFAFNETQYYLPQLELARALFLHYGYLARLSLIHNGLKQEFDVQRMSGSIRAIVNILPTCSLPLYVRGNYALRRMLAWILLDDDVRQSFESIARYQLEYGDDSEKFRRWCFQFEPPSLSGVELSVRGHFSQERKVFFVYEIYGVTNLACKCETVVDFIDPRFTDLKLRPGREGQPGSESVPEFEIDDEQEADSDQPEVWIDTPLVKFEFVNPIKTTRIAKRKTQGDYHRQGEHTANPPEKTSPEVSTGEGSTQGTAPPANYDGVDDKSDDAHLYAVRFEAFNAMVNRLASMPGCSLGHREIRKLPSIAGFSKHLLVDKNPRCLDVHLVNKGDSVFALLEIDTSDNKNRLSTLVLKQSALSTDWKQYLSHLEIQLLKRSLVWPTSFLSEKFGSEYRRIPHQKSSVGNKALLEREYIDRWAERVYREILAY
jgi:hypothetical protein